jgi:hypothetical protein
MTALLSDVFSVAAILGALGSYADEESKILAHAFSIGKETNQSYVSYDVRLTPDCRIDKDDPLKLYWVTPLKEGGARQDSLNLIEKKLYGMDVQKTEPTMLLGEVKAVKRRRTTLKLRITSERASGKCVVHTYVTGDTLSHEMTISSLYLQSFSGQKPNQVAINGRDSETGKPEKHVIIFG